MLLLITNFAYAYCTKYTNIIAKNNIKVDLGSDQTSLHNPWAGGYYPVGLSFEESKVMMAENPQLFKEKVQEINNKLEENEKLYIVVMFINEDIDTVLEENIFKVLIERIKEFFYT